jgi:phosphopantetheine adenylyltransferase
MFNRDKICILQNRQDNEVLIALTKDELLQDKVIDFLKKLDDKYIFNVNNYLSELILKQKDNTR